MTRVKDQMTIEGTDTEASNLCDEYLECRNAVEEEREKLHASEAALVSYMTKAGKKSIKHDGKVIRLVHQEEKNKIQAVSVSE